MWHQFAYGNIPTLSASSTKIPTKSAKLWANQKLARATGSSMIYFSRCKSHSGCLNEDFACTTSCNHGDTPKPILGGTNGQFGTIQIKCFLNQPFGEPAAQKSHCCLDNMSPPFLFLTVQMCWDSLAIICHCSYAFFSPQCPHLPFLRAKYGWKNNDHSQFEVLKPIWVSYFVQCASLHIVCMGKCAKWPACPYFTYNILALCTSKCFYTRNPRVDLLLLLFLYCLFVWLSRKRWLPCQQWRLSQVSRVHQNGRQHCK